MPRQHQDSLSDTAIQDHETGSATNSVRRCALRP